MQSKTRGFPWKLLIVSVLLAGCTRLCGPKRGDLSPEQVVEGYLNVALNMTSVKEREKLTEYTTGNLKAAIDGASDETIKKAYVDRKYEILTYAVVERNDRTPRETEVAFQLTYKDFGLGGKINPDAPKITTENTVSVVREDGAWRIRDVMGNKTSIDFPVADESRITARAGDNTPVEEPNAETPAEDDSADE